ncbi:MAG: hypothetical protein WED09_14600 [Homoserinimonas sp.]
MTRTIVRVLATGCAAALILAGCASPQSDDAGGGVKFDPDTPPTSIAADGEVLGQGTVLQIDGEPVNLCLGAVAESYPPQCSGPEVMGWDWASVDGEETASSVTWGTYAVQGTWDGQRLTLTQPPIMLALYSPMMVPDPLREPGNAGDTPEAELLAIQSEIHDLGTVEVLSSGVENGYLFVTVVYDDGQFQSYFDELYGADLIVVESALRPITP